MGFQAHKQENRITGFADREAGSQASRSCRQAEREVG